MGVPNAVGRDPAVPLVVGPATASDGETAAVELRVPADTSDFTDRTSPPTVRRSPSETRNV